MPFPFRFVVCTFNLWADAHWPQRQRPLEQFLSRHRPDVLCLQEFRPETRDLFDDVLANHARVDDPFVGWLQESNIYWNQDLFQPVGYGAEDIGQLEEWRRLFWVRLRLRAEGERLRLRTGGAATLFVSTAHYTWPGHEIEETQGINPRLAQARQTVAVLNELVPESEPLLFMGDLNDYLHPLRILRESGLMDSFTALGRQSPPTRPPLPKLHEASPQINDWVLHRGPLRPMTCDVVDFFVGNRPPSDHKPVLVTYEYLT
jgi:endonuclease/exonuclease/phosphatase family metal-dependent hydrolase